MELYASAYNSRNIRRANGYRTDQTDRRPSFQAIMALIDTADPAWPTIAVILKEMADSGVELDETAVQIAVKVGTRRLAIAGVQGRPPKHIYHQATMDGTAGSIVYYIRRGDLIKIGTTADPVMRFSDLMPDEILAFEPGDFAQENLRHRQFGHLRRRGEHFRIAPELLEHIRQLRRLHGTPDPSWPSAATQWKDYEPPGENLTVAEACKRFGFNPNTLYWRVRHGVITPAGRDKRGRLVFDAEQLAEARAKPIGQGRRTDLLRSTRR